MVAILIIVALLIVVAIGAGVLSRRKAAERAGVEQERRVIACDLSDHQQERDAAPGAEPRFTRARARDESGDRR
jgi:hypothetical protein